MVMMRRASLPVEPRLLVMFLAILVAFAAGCASSPDTTDDMDDEGMDSEFSDASDDMTPPPSNVDDTTVADRSARDINISPVYFDFDSYEIRGEFEAPLRRAADALRSANTTVVIEGHCDERGSEEYNLALGERRAGAVRRYLYNLGVPMARMTTVSYGEAQPAVSGTGEQVWQLNRRAEFELR